MDLIHPATPVLGPQLASASAPVSATGALSATPAIGMEVPTITEVTLAPEQFMTEKKFAPGACAGGTAPVANVGLGAAEGGTAKKSGRLPGSLPPISSWREHDQTHVEGRGYTCLVLWGNLILSTLFFFVLYISYVFL